MTTSTSLLEAIRDAADPFGTAQPGVLLQSAGMRRPDLARALGDLAGRGLVEIDRDSGAVSLTVSGRAELFAHAPTLAPNVGLPYEPPDYAFVRAPVAAPPKAAGASRELGPGLGSAPQPPPGLTRRRAAAPGLTGKAAAAAVKQAQDTAMAVKRRQAAKKASPAAAASKAAKPKAAKPGAAKSKIAAARPVTEAARRGPGPRKRP